MSRRKRLASLLHQTGLVRAALALRATTPSQWLTILTYHRFPDPSGEELFDDEVIDAAPDVFERQIACLKRHFTLIGIDELCAFAAGSRLPPNSIAITFDDGYLDCYTRVLPVLARYDAKATFFVSTTYLSERRLYWWDRVSYILKRSTLARVVLEYPSRRALDLTDRPTAIARVLRVVKTHPELDIEYFLDGLAEAAGVYWSRALERSYADRLLMTWAQVRALRAAGMDIESHTRTHRVLQTLTPDSLHDELAGSRSDLARELGTAPRAIAYPVGNPLVSTSPIRAALADAGYEIGFSNCTGANPINQAIDRYNIRRQPAGMSLSEDYLLALLALPALAPRPYWDAATG
jgi:peptidoglycan/xylan/chitin deacetylase (PgdA/CDA1 family)